MPWTMDIFGRFNNRNNNNTPVSQHLWDFLRSQTLLRRYGGTLKYGRQKSLKTVLNGYWIGLGLLRIRSYGPKHGVQNHAQGLILAIVCL